MAGWSIAQGFWARTQVASVGRISERARFRRCGNHSAREAALAAAFLENSSGGDWRAICDEEIVAKLREDWEVAADFPEVLWQLLRRSQWETVQHG
eukprot:10771266-Lingulodinium_polyedra.AAC.1